MIEFIENMKTIKVMVVPDVHGRKFWKDAITKVFEVDRVVFLGDYVDPYDYVGDGAHYDPIELVGNVKDIVQFAKDNAPKVSVLIGNHDAHYISDSPYIQSSRYDGRVKNGLLEVISENPSLFTKCEVIGGTLFSHAGVTKGWLEYNGYAGDMNDVNEVAAFIKESTIENIAQVGSSRGGGFPYGGPLWADVSEHMYNELNFNQVIGHTPLRDTGAVVSVGSLKQISVYDSRSTHIIEVEVS